MWNKIKAQLKKFKNWIIFTVLGVSVALAAGQVLPDKIPEYLKLKCNKADIVRSSEYTKYKYKNGEIINQEQIVTYSYKSNELVPAFENEIIEKRTKNIVTRKLDKNKYSAESGYDFYQDKGKWKRIKYATTTSEIFNKVSFLESFIAWAAVTGATSPGTMSDDNTVGTVAWTDVDNAKVSNNIYADCWTGGVGGIIENSIKIVKDDVISGDDKSTGAAIPTNDTYVSYGTSDNLWGLSWTAVDINASTFGVVYSPRNQYTIIHYLKAVNFGFSINGTINGILIEVEQKMSESVGSNLTEFFVDHIRITVYYTAEGEEEVPPQVQSEFFFD